MISATLLVLILSPMHTVCLRHVARGPSLQPASIIQPVSRRSFSVTSPRSFTTGEIATTSNLSTQGFVTEGANAYHEVTFPDGDIDFITESKDAAQVLNGIFWILKKAARAYSLYSKANNVKLALEETKEAVEDAAGTVERMGSKIVRIHDYFMKTGLGAFLQCIEEGDVDAFAKSDFSDAIEEVESLADELDDLLTVSRTVVTVLKNVRGIAADTNELIDGLLPVELDKYLIPLEKHVSEAVLQVERFLLNLKGKCAEAKESFERFLQYDLAKGKEYAKMKAEKLFGDLTPLIGDFDEVYTSLVKPLILELVKAIKAIYESAKRLKLPLDAPESVADETIDPARCSWRQTRWFKSIEDYNVDIEKTMVCDSVKTFGLRFKCWCIGTNDCYVDSKYRPGAKDSRRCFQKA